MRILLVDDETSVIQALLATLKTIPGHDVRVATSGEKALENASAMGGLDLLITDVVMDPMDGFTLRDQMVSRYPKVRTIFVSGYDLSDYPEQTANHRMLQKPVDSQALLAAVQAELAVLAPAPAVAAEAPKAPRAQAAAAAIAAVPDVIFARRQPAAQPAVAAQAAPVSQPTVKATPAAQPVAQPAVKAVPAAQPVAQPSVKAVPAAQPAVKAVPTAQPVAQPAVKATPAAQPVAQPAVKAVPAAQPVAQPAVKAVPAAPAAPAVKAVPAAQPVAKAVPAAQPVAQPVAKAVPAPAAVPVAQPAVKATPAAPTAHPVVKAVPVGKPAHASGAIAAPNVTSPIVKPVPAAAPAAPVPPVHAPLPPPPPGAGESLMGQTLGAYQIVSYLGEGRLGSAYAAVQISINRPVGLKVLDPERAQDDAIKGRFIADARAKAHVQHPAILAVYEAGEAEGRFFFAREYVDGQSLAEISASGTPLPEPTILKIIKTVAEGFIYLNTQNLPHRPLDATRVFVTHDGSARLANIAVQIADEHQTVPQELQTLGRLITSVCHVHELSPGLQTVITRLQQSPASGLNAWGQVVQAAKALEPKIVPVAAARLSAQDEAALRAVEAARKAQRRSFLINTSIFVLLFGVLVGVVLKKFVFTNERKIQATVKIPAGKYKLPGGKTASIENDFWIDKFEVTIAQYNRFLEYMAQHPAEEREFRHPKMPPSLELRPEYWDIYYGRAKVNKPAHSVPIDLNCPALTVNWWGAYAYAKWLGKQTGTERDLPTEEEWEVAAAGKEGYKYPWGNEFDETRSNTNVDHNPDNPGAKGGTDGYNFWGEVDAKTGDKSPFGVIGMGGNLAEWTSTWTKDKQFPIIKGGSFAKPPTTIDKKISDVQPGKGEEWIGFRTISRNAPADVE